MARIPVLVVGGGPVGLALAGDLGWRGVACELVERADGAIRQAKMDMVGIRTMEFCRRWGIVEAVEAGGYNRAYPQDCAWVTSLNGHEFGREHFPAPQDEKCPPQSPQKRERCPQNFFDPVLRRFAESHPGVALSYNTELVDFDERPDGVVARLQDAATGALRINYAMFGNLEPALHAHLVPRYADEPAALRSAHPWAYDWAAAPQLDAAAMRPLAALVRARLGVGAPPAAAR